MDHHTTGTLDVPDAALHYELRGTGPLLVLVAAPMDARSFAPLAELLAADHTVLTTDPRGIFRSTVADRDADATPELRAEDLARLIVHADAGPASILGSSGGAVSVLALVQAHPDLVATAIAHEPPLHAVLPDRAELRARTDTMLALHASGDSLGAGRMFADIANLDIPEPVLQAMFGPGRSVQDKADADFQNEHMLLPTVAFEPDLDALSAAPTRLLVGLGEDSGGQLCDRASRALARLLGTEPTMFPGGHVGFAEDPERFAPRLREVLAESRG